VHHLHHASSEVALMEIVTKTGRILETLVNKNAAKKVIKEGRKVVVYSKVSSYMIKPIDVTTLDELNAAAIASTGNQIQNLASLSKPAYHEVLKEPANG
jgi:glutamate dehydrogenase/leucine dehydrogenase